MSMIFVQSEKAYEKALSLTVSEIWPVFR